MQVEHKLLFLTIPSKLEFLAWLNRKMCPRMIPVELFDFPLPGDIAASKGEISLLSADSGCIISLSVELYPPTKIFTIIPNLVNYTC